MQEVAFLKQNAEKWKEMEHLLTRRGSFDPDRLAALFLEITDDLSYARTFFPDSKATEYLNALAMQMHQRIYRNKKEDRGRFLTFWAVELPALFYHSHRQLFYAFMVVVIGAAIGVLSTLFDETFIRLILGDSYVNLTLENIRQGDPMAIYKSQRGGTMFAMITINNIMVAFMTFIYGILLSVGTVWILLRNAVMIGAFFTLFYQQGVLSASMLAVWVHGTLEISAIIIAGAAGLTMGNSILFPGTYTRRRSLMNGARQGLKITVGLVPIFIMAGFLESFVTRHTDMPLVVNLLIIFLSLGFIIGYFIIYPIYLNRKREPHGNGTNQRISTTQLP